MTPNADGSYTAELPALQAGDHQITATVNGKSSAQDTLEVKKPTPISSNNSSGTGNRGERGVINNITMATSDITRLQSGDNLSITVTIIDAFNNPLTAIAPNNIILDGYKANSLKWLDNGDGTYTTPLLLMQTGTSELVASINGHKSPLITITVGNTTDINKVANIELEPITPSEAGEAQTITVKVTDKYQHPVTTINKMITANINGQSAPIILTESLTQKGTYTGTLPAQKTGKYTVEVTANNKAASKPWDVKTAATITAKEKDGSGTANQRGVVKTVTLVSSPINDLKSGQSLQLTVALKDAFGNPLEGISGASLQLKHQQPSVSSVNWVDLRNGDYTTILPLTKIGQDTLTVKVNQITTSPLNINVGNATGTTQIHKVDIKNIEKPAAGETSAITLILSDANNQPITGVNNNAVVSINGAEELLKIAETTNKGTYIGTLSGQKSGDHKVIVAVGGVKSTESTLTVSAPVPIAINNSGKSGSRGVINHATLAVSPTKDLKSGDALTLTATLEDAFGNPLTGIDLTQSLTHKQTGKVTWTAQKDGTYTANLVLTQLGPDHLFITANKIQSPTIIIDVKSQLGTNAIHKIDISDITNAAAGAQSTFTVVLNDAQGNPVNGIQNLDVTLDKQKLPNIVVTQQADGRYSGKLPGQQSGSYDVVISANKQSSTAKTLMVAQPDTITANGGGTADQRGVVSQVTLQAIPNTKLTSGDTVQLTVALKDSFNNPLKGVDSASIVLQHNQQAATMTWIDQNNGSYTTTLPLNGLGRNTLKTTVNRKESLPINIDVASPHHVAQVHQLTLEPISSSSTGSAQTITVKVADTNSHGVTQVADDIKATLNDKPLNLTFAESKTDKGTYTAPLPAQKAGSYLVKVAMNKQEAKETWIVSAATTLKAIHADGSGVQSNAGVVNTVELTTTASSFKSGESVKLTLTLKDAFDNALNGIDVKNITLAHHQTGTNVTWVDNQNGTYTTDLPLTTLGADRLVTTVNQIKSTSVDINVEKASGNSQIHHIEIVDITNAAAGAQSTFTVVLNDAQGNPVNGIQNLDVTLDKQKLPNIVVTQQADGRYSGKLPGQQSGSYDVVISANKQSSTAKTLTVAQPDTVTAAANGGGTADQRGVVSQVTLQAIPNTKLASGDTVQLTVALKDSFNNPLKGVDSASIVLQHNQRAATVTWIDQNNGSYTTTLPLNELGRNTLKTTVNSKESLPINIDVASPHQVAQVHQLTLEPITSSSAGSAQTITVKAIDANSHGVTQIADDIKVTLNDKSLNLTFVESKTDKGTYTAPLPAQKAGSYLVKVAMNKQEAKETWIVSAATTLKAIHADGSGVQSNAGVVNTVELTTTASSFKSGESVKLTLTLKDAFDNALNGIDVKNITLAHHQTGANVTWVDNTDGTYTANVDLKILGKDALTATVNKINSQPIDFEVIKTDDISKVKNVEIVLTPTAIAGMDSTLVVALTDLNHHAVTGIKEVTVQIDKTHSSTIAVAPLDNGHYILTLPAKQSGSYDIVVTANNINSTPKTWIVSNPSTIVAENSDGSGTPGQRGVVANVQFSTVPSGNLQAGSHLILTVMLKDSFNNPLRGIDSNSIAITHQQSGAVTWKDNGDGTYTANLLLSKLGTDTLKVTVNTISQSQDIDVKAPQGESAVNKVELKAANKTFKVGDSVELQLTLTDSYGNGVEKVQTSDIQLDHNHVLVTKLTWLEKGAGIYTTTLPLHKQGKNTFVSQVNNKANASLTVNVSALTDPTQVKTVELKASTNQLTVGSQTELTLTLTDQWNNGVEGITAKDIIINDAHIKKNLTGLSWISKGNGIYTAPTVVSIAGIHSLRATVNQIQSHNILIDALPSTNQSHINKVLLTTNLSAITAGSKVTLSLKVTDADNNPVIHLNNTITLTDGNHKISTVWDEDNHGLGLYSTNILLSDVKTHNLTASIGQFTDTASVTVNSPVGKDAVKTITMTPVANSDAGQPSSLSVGLTDQYKNPVKNVSSGDITVTINGQKQDIVFMEKNVLNKYIAQLPASKAGRYQIMVEANGQSETVDWNVNSPKEISITSYDKNGLRGSLETISITHSAKNNTANSGDNVTLTVGLKDKFDNKLTGAASSLKLLTNLQSASAWKELSGGLYTQELTMNKLRKQPIQVVADKALSDKLELNVDPAKGANHVHKTTLETNEDTIEAGHDVLLTLALTDKVNNSVIDVDTNAIQLTNNGKPTTVTWANPQDGLYTTKLRLDTVGNHQFKATVNNQPSRIQTIEVTAPSGQAKVAKAQLVSNIASLDAGKDVELTLTLKDQYGNLVIGVNGADIALKDSHTTETIASSNIAWQMISAGVYKTALPLTKVGKHTLTAAVNNITESTDITVTALKGASNVNEIKLTADNTTISAGESTTLTLTLLDSYGNEVVDVAPKDIQLKNTDSTITTTASWVKDPSHNHVYTAKVTLEKVKRHTLSVDVNSQSKNIAIEVKTLEGAKNVAKIELNMSEAARLGANMPLTLQLKDKFGNGVIYVASQDIQLTNNGQAENITWTEGSQGQYEANWLSRKVGKHQLDVVVNANRLAKPIDIELAPPQGAKSVDSIGIDMLDTAEVGDTVNVTLKLQDKYGVDVIDISSNDITLLSDKQTLPTLVWSDDKHGNYTADVKFDTVGKHTLTVNINNSAKTAEKKEINIKALPPVFANGKSEFSVDTDSVEGNGKDKATVTLKLMDKNSTPISGRKPKLTATMGNINSVMDEKSPGEYTSTFNSSTVGTSKLAIDSSSIDYSGSVPEITIVTYGTPEIQTIGDQSVFAIDSGFPNTGFEGAQFRITVPVGQPTDYSWSVDSDWLSIDDKGVVTMQRKPTTSAMTPTFKGVPKPHTGYKRTVDYRFTLKKWYVRSGQSYNFNRIAARNCAARGDRLVKYNDLAAAGAISNRKVGEQLLQEWGATFTLNKLGIVYSLWTDDYEHTSTLYSFFKRSSLEHVTLSSSQLRDYAELDILCVNDLN
ncbi:invasin domain 3-containing protein [Providencia sp.]|uniref:invasin domain 3-containing protein n=1 Tax=Providencia sp. TaxID=589 RepID=UPI00333F1AF1